MVWRIYINNEIQINRFGLENLSYNLSDLLKSDQKISFVSKGLRNAHNTSIGDFIVSFRINK